ncbi:MULTISPECIES: glycerol-3-phosphate 1-O-acyltransferase PlsY [Clostridium]|uniref:glycerol-3-phosphate 1-O-acyltransferase PlsY n=1 Tax=Clostridium TaxID=1485 RepID=UPI000826E48F|nr:MULTISPECIES: glycerol-3-phosphate 1-O-acyltransferase PlsY [Clostridium]PJI08199.1 glycerol-3-phosphate acyltransferase [Clostridium sp. CT7]
MIILLTIIVSFLFGSIPTGYLITKKLCGIDIRTKGSGNIGSTNVKRIVGTKLAILTQAGDVIKGIIPMILGIYLSKTIKLPVTTEVYLSIIPIACVLGHDYTPFLGFNGGKGVNTTLGAYFLIAPLPVLLGVLIHFILLLFTKIVAIRSIVLGISIPLTCAIMKLPLPIIISASLASILLIYRHKDNIKNEITLIK